jgi:Ca-activated chloride channel homolog
MVHFQQPEWLWLLAVLPLVLIWRGRKGQVAAVQYSNISVARSVSRDTHSKVGRWLWLLPVLGAAFMVVGLARPQLLHGRTDVNTNGIDILLGLDVSGSMQALDFKQDGQRVNRIEVVKSVVSKFIDERSDDRIGILAFAGAPYLVSPLTLDHDWLQQNLERISVGGTEDGTAIGSAIAASVNDLRSSSAKSKVVILLTDGMNNTGKISPFYRATDTDSLKHIYEQINRLEKTTQTAQHFEFHQELFAWALFPALAFLGLGFGLEHTRFRRLP